MVKHWLCRRRQDALAALVETGPQHRVPGLHQAHSGFKASRFDALAVELEPSVTTDIAQHFSGATAQPVGLLHGTEFEALRAC
ncbi:hypothetical protein D3C84_875080 [compost metagenome]